MAYYDALIAKWATLTGTTAQKLAAINALTVPAPPIPMIVPSHDVYEAIDNGEFSGLNAANQALIRDLLNMGSVNLSSGSKARARMVAVFGGTAGPLTRANLTAMAQAYENRTQLWWSAPVEQGGGGLTSHVTENDLIAAGGLT